MITSVREWRSDSYDYMTGADWQKGLSGITPSSAPRPRPFAWGRVLHVYVVGDEYAIVEYVPNRSSNVKPEDYDPSPQFSVFVRGARGNGWDTARNCSSLDAALLTCIAWRAEQRTGGINAAANSSAVRYISQMLGLVLMDRTITVSLCSPDHPPRSEWPDQNLIRGVCPKCGWWEGADGERSARLLRARQLIKEKAARELEDVAVTAEGFVFGPGDKVRRPNNEDARRERAVEMLKGHVRRQRPDTYYDADLEYLDAAILAFVDEWTAPATFEAFLGGYEAVYDEVIDIEKVRVSYEEWRSR